MTKMAVKLVVPVGIVSAMWFSGYSLNTFGGTIDTIGAYLCRIAFLGVPFVLIPAIVFMFFPAARRMSVVERQLILWVALATIADIWIHFLFPLAGWRALL